MADEVTFSGSNIDRGSIVFFEVADGTAISKGTLMIQTSSPYKAAKHSAANEVPAGIAVSEKEASDGQIQMGCLRRGVVTGVAGAEITFGDPLIYDVTANRFAPIVGSPSFGTMKSLVGRALQSAADGGSFLLYLNIL